MSTAPIYKQLIESCGEDITREGLVKTPDRAAKAFQDLTVGYTQSIDEIVNGAIFQSDETDMIIVKDIELYSLCEHHLLPFFGKCHVAYLPNGRIVGLSKVARIVDMFARRLQVQEHLTSEIAHAIETLLDVKGVAVVIEANHLCMRMRGIEKQNSTMVTSSMLGLFRSSNATRSEFLQLIR